MLHEDFLRTRYLMHSSTAAGRIAVKDTRHCFDCFTPLCKEVEECVFDLKVLLRWGRVRQR
jgi:hypothetical protein